MTVACIEAELLDTLLAARAESQPAAPLEGLARDHARGCADVIQDAWCGAGPAAWED
jgi:hypothetical protein